MQWFLNNVSTIVLGLILAGIVALVIVRMIKNRRAGKTTCGCSDCAMCGSCHTKKK